MGGKSYRSILSSRNFNLTADSTVSPLNADQLSPRLTPICPRRSFHRARTATCPATYSKNPRTQIARETSTTRRSRTHQLQREARLCCAFLQGRHPRRTSHHLPPPVSVVSRRANREIVLADAPKGPRQASWVVPGTEARLATARRSMPTKMSLQPRMRLHRKKRREDCSRCCAAVCPMMQTPWTTSLAMVPDTRSKSFHHARRLPAEGRLLQRRTTRAKPLRSFRRRMCRAGILLIPQRRSAYQALLHRTSPQVPTTRNLPHCSEAR